MIHPPAARRLRELAVNARLMVTTAASHLAEDPLLLVLQTSRRMPRPLVELAARGISTGAQGGRHDGIRVTWAAWLSGHPDEAAEILERLSTRRSTGLRGRLLAELAIQVSRPDLIDVLVDDPPPPVRARAAWLRGDMTAATEHLAGARSSSQLAARHGAEGALMRPDARLTPSAHVETTGVVDTVAAFHILTNSLPHTQSGYALRSHAVLMAQAAAGIRVVAATRLGYPASIGVLRARHTDLVDGVTYRRVLPPTLPRTLTERLQGQVELLVPVVERFSPSVLHTTTNFHNALVTEALATTFGVPWVYEVRGFLEETWVASRRTPDEQTHAAASERYRSLRAKEAEVAASADHVVTLSGTMRAELIARGVDAERITVVPNAVDAALLATTLDAPTARRAVGLAGEGFWVGTVSSLVDYEGLDTLIDAVAELRRRGVDARACIVGDGVARPGLEQRARREGIAQHVVFTGRVPRDRAALYHQALDVFVVPRRDVRVCRHVTPLKPIEAMACARPVVASDLPALAELVRGPGSGELTPAGDVQALADALTGLASSPERRAQLGAAGRVFAATRTWQNAADAYRTLYAGLAGVVA